MLHHLQIKNYQTLGQKTQDIELSYQLFGQELHSAPIVLVNHALTGNSNVTGDGGWWSALIGEGKCIDTNKYTILSFNIPGNGYDKFVIEIIRILWQVIWPVYFFKGSICSKLKSFMR